MQLPWKTNQKLKRLPTKSDQTDSHIEDIPTGGNRVSENCIQRVMYNLTMSSSIPLAGMEMLATMQMMLI